MKKMSTEKEGTICEDCGNFVPPEIEVYALPGKEVRSGPGWSGCEMIFVCKECYKKRKED